MPPEYGNEPLASDEEATPDQDPIEEGLASYFNEVDENVTNDRKSEQNKPSAISSHIGGIIDCLLKLSVSMSNPAPHDRYKSRAGNQTLYYEPWYVQHVEEKYPHLDSAVIERLGKALAQRRGYFNYREDHHHRLSQDDGKDTASETVASSLPRELRDDFSGPRILDDSISEASATSYAPSTVDSSDLRVPNMPQRNDNGHFLCPYCYTYQSANSRYEWKYVM